MDATLLTATTSTPVQPLARYSALPPRSTTTFLPARSATRVATNVFSVQTPSVIVPTSTTRLTLVGAKMGDGISRMRSPWPWSKSRTTRASGDRPTVIGNLASCARALNQSTEMPAVAPAGSVNP